MASSREGRQTLKLLSSGHSLHSQPLPTLPFDLIPDILSRLPVKLLLQLRCVCKSWKSLISDPKFAKKHLRLSTMRSLHFIGYKEHSLGKYVLNSYPLHSILKNINTNFTQFEYFANKFDGDYLADSFRYFIDSCDGILCIGGSYKGLVILWNPSLRKFKELPLFEKPKVSTHLRMSFGFGYDSFKENYKVIVVLHYLIRDSTGSDNWVHKSEVKVHTLGSNIWKNIHEFPFGVFPVARSGKFVSGTINWLASRQFHTCTRSIVSFDLAKESYQKISPPSYGGVDVCNMLTLGVLRDCLCLICGDGVWVMKEYGKKESWNKLFTIPYMLYRGRYSIYTKVIYVFEDDQVLLKDLSDSALILYNSKNGTHKSINFIDIPEVCIESLIWPCS